MAVQAEVLRAVVDNYEISETCEGACKRHGAVVHDRHAGAVGRRDLDSVRRRATLRCRARKSTAECPQNGPVEVAAKWSERERRTRRRTGPSQVAQHTR